MISPLLAGALIGAAGTAAQGVASIVPTKIERSQKEELAKLKRQQELGALGLTPAEMEAYQNRLGGRVEQAATQAAQDRARLLAGAGGATGGQQMAQAVAADEQRMKLEADASAKMLELDIARKKEQEERIRALEAADSEARAKRIQAIVGAGLAGATGAIQGAAVSKMMSGPKDISPELLNDISQKYGVSTEAARGIADQMIKSSDSSKYLELLLFGKK